MTYTPESLPMPSREVTLRHGRLRVTLAVDLDGAEARARIAKVTTTAGDVVVEPLESEDVTELAHRAIEEAKRLVAAERSEGR